MSAWSDMKNAVAEASTVLRAADSYAGDMAQMLRGRLRHVPTQHLVALKRELRDFDAQQKVWK